MKNTFEEIIKICGQNTDTEGTLEDIRVMAQNRVIRYEWEEKYGIKLDEYCKLAQTNFYKIDDNQIISYFKDGYKDRKQGCGKYISWSEKDKQPVNEWLFELSFSTGAYFFGRDYDGQQQLFQDFFEELRTYKPDYEDLHNNDLYWKIENAKEIMSQFKVIVKKYINKNNNELKAREIVRLEEQLENLKK